MLLLLVFLSLTRCDEVLNKNFPKTIRHSANNHGISNHRSRTIVWDPARLSEVEGHSNHGGLKLALNKNMNSFKSKLQDIRKTERAQLKEKFLHSKG